MGSRSAHSTGGRNLDPPGQYSPQSQNMMNYMGYQPGKHLRKFSQGINLYSPRLNKDVRDQDLNQKIRSLLCRGHCRGATDSL